MDDSALEDAIQDEAPAESSAESSAESRASAAASDELAALREEKAALHDRLLRTAAEFDNYRKRTDRERRELSEYAAADVLGDLLSILDDLERALLTPAGPEAEAYRKGVELIQKQMLEVLRKRGVTPLEAVGKDFDPNFHQAVIHEVSPDHRDGEVTLELRRGYMLGERLLRPAMVKVAKAS